MQAALARIPTADSLQILEKLTYNTAVQPKEAKFRKVKLQNPKIKASIADVDAALDVLRLLGWQHSEDEADGEVLILPEKTHLTMQQVRDIQQAQQNLDRKERDLKRSASAKSIAAVNSAAA